MQMITLSKLAKLANVSVSTASKAFSGSSEVNEKTRNMIFDIAKKHRCFKKFYNVKYPKLVIAIIAPEFKSAYYTRYLSYIQENLEKENCELCVSTTNFSPEKEQDLLEYYYKHSNVDGIIVIQSALDAVREYEIPVVFVNPSRSQPHRDSASRDAFQAFRDAVQYLVDKKVHSIGFIGEKLTHKKQQMLQQILEEQGIPLKENYVSISGARFEEGGYTAMEKLFSQNQLPRAIFCAYDYMAIGAIRCIYDHGLTVPGDIAVLGYDDIPEARFLNPPLASISVPMEKLCQIAADSIIRKIHGSTVDCSCQVASEFKLRRSFEIS